jgi:CheY-like chemotaxis protein/histone H3/H4
MKERPPAANDEHRLLDAIGLLAGGIAHEFNNLLAAIQGYTDLLDDTNESNVTRRADLDEIRLATRRAATLTRQLLAFSRKQLLTPKLLRTSDVLEAIGPILRRLVGDRIELEVITDGRDTVMADQGQLEQALVNLVANARDAIDRDGRITIETRDVLLTGDGEGSAGVPPGHYAVITVSDTGCGMDQETQTRIFEPFFTTKPRDRGTGLGLAIVYGIVKQSNGHVSVDSEIGRGTTFRIYLPLYTGAAGTEGIPEPANMRAGSERILVVDDEEKVREFVNRALLRVGYTVLVAATPQAALEIAERESTSIDLLLTDVLLPEMKGPALAHEVRLKQPACRVLYMSGYTANAVTREGEDRDADFLQKPFSLDTLRTKVREVLDRPRARSLSDSV